MSLIKREIKGSPLTINELDNNFTYLESLVGSQSGSVTLDSIDILYADLYNLVVTESLETGKWYRLTDYKSVNYINGNRFLNDLYNGQILPTDPNFNAHDTHVGQDEVILLYALSNSEISTTGYSETYRGDVIDYLPYVNKLGYNLNVYEGADLPGLSGSVTGFNLQWDGTNVFFELPVTHPISFGHYLYLYIEFDNSSYYQDGAFEPVKPGVNICQYPYVSGEPSFGYGITMSRIEISGDGLTVKLLDLTENDYNNYDSSTLNIEYVHGITDAYGWVRRRKDTNRNIDVPFDFRELTYRRFEIDLSAINMGIDYYSIGPLHNGFYPTTGNFHDFKSLDVQGEECYNVIIEGLGGPDEYMWCSGSVYNNVFYCRLSNVNFNCTELSRNTIGSLDTSPNFNSNVIGGYFTTNIIKYSFNDVNVLNMSGNTIRSLLSKCNIIDFSSNTITSGSFQYNELNTFNLNTITGNFLNNRIKFFTSNQTGDGFQNNDIYDINGIDLTSATHVYAFYNTTVRSSQSGQPTLSYINSSNILTLVNVNS